LAEWCLSFSAPRKPFDTLNARMNSNSKCSGTSA
jgi:hypothetical protein